MKSHLDTKAPASARRSVLWLSVLTLPCSFLFAQEADQDEEVFELSPFTVDAGDDQGYRATSTMAGTRIRTELRDVGSAISVVTEEFLKDTNSTDSSSLLVYTTSTEVGGPQGNFSGLGNGGSLVEDSSMLRPNTNTRVRGLGSAANTRDFFLTDLPWDSYNVSRVELQRGPNSILFGLGSPSGIVNTHTKRANYEDSTELGIRFDQHGSFRGVLDVNRMLIEDQLAARVIYLNDRGKFQQEQAFNNDERIFAAVKYEPSFMKSDRGSFELNANVEKGDIEANRPRTVPPVDRITPWFTDMNQETFNPLEAYPNGVVDAHPWIGQMYGGNFIYFADPHSSEQFSLDGVTAFPREASGVNFPSDTEDTRSFARMIGVNGFGGWANNVRDANGNPLPFRSDYKDKVLTDPTIYNFYDKLIDGETKREFRDFESVNISAAHTFLDNKLGYELVYNKQKYSDAQYKHMLGDNTSIQIDVNTHYLNGTPNPNVGRPFVSNRTTYTSSGSSSERESTRLTAFAEFDFADVMDSDSFMTRLLGKHTFTGLLSEDKSDRESRDWAQYALDGAYSEAIGVSNSIDPNRELQVVSYLGDSLIGKSLASGLNLSTISVPQTPNASQSISIYDLDAMQWDGYSYGLLNASQGAQDLLYRGARKDRDVVESKAIVWQGKFMEGVIVPTIGIRSDEAETSTVQAPNAAFGAKDVYSPDYRIGAEPDSIAEGTTKTYSLVLHTPQAIRDRMPAGTNVSLLWNKSENFEPAAGRIDPIGNPLAPPSGETEEIGFIISTFEDKLSLKVNWYETTAAYGNANLGLSMWFLGAVESRAWVAAKRFEAGLTGDPAFSGPDFNYGTNIGGEFVQTAEDRALQQAHVQAVLSNYVPEMAEAWGWGNAPDTKWQEGQWDPWSSGGFEPAGITTTADSKSEGTEYELFYRPTDNWDIMVNAARVEAQRTNVGDSIRDWVEARNEVWRGPAGDIRMWNGTGSGSMGQQWTNTFHRRWQLQQLLSGTNVAELREWRFNAISNYRFVDGALKGFNVGGAYRWEDEVAIGYPPISTPDGDSFDIDNPYMGDAEGHLDLWFGYSRTISDDRINWRVQLNVKDVFGSQELIELTRNPDGSMAGARISPSRQFSLANTFSF